MEKYILNETPVRTANNFNINNIEVELKIPEYKEFNNFNLSTEDIKKIQVDVSNKNITNINKIGLERKTNYCVKIVIPENTKIEEILTLEFEIDEENEFLVENIEIILEKESEANLEIIWKDGNCEKETFHNGQIKTKLKENAKGKITIANMINSNSTSIYAIENEIDKKAELEYTIIEVGGKTKISNYHSKIKGDFSKNYLNMMYLGKENDVIDINYNMELYGKKSQAYINVQGAIKDSAKKNFKGTIDFKKGSSKSIGKEKENCILLSPDVKSKSLPMLLCSEEDVEGEHGVSSGKIDENKLFYIMTKGISYEDAKKLIIKASFNEIINNIENEELKKQIENKL